ncbi:hypothetical protein M5G25_16095 [Pseudomonas sp. TNT2022 ID357]|uniref:Uncharacterized protein n=1 Tax=Pseudomonas idahonensis TaxID=2942628 RepID=A0ABT5Q7W4_9PSED|nr:hypothetical protein [Pseudomonas idahonensis]MDD1149811.1 hypothetical protein [Pseudomonas idahonensis]
MAMVITVRQQPAILRYTASNGEYPGEFEEIIVLPSTSQSSAQASMKPTTFRMISSVSFCPLMRYHTSRDTFLVEVGKKMKFGEERTRQLWKACMAWIDGALEVRREAA